MLNIILKLAIANLYPFVKGLLLLKKSGIPVTFNDIIKLIHDNGLDMGTAVMLLRTFEAVFPLSDTEKEIVDAFIKALEG